MLRLGQNRQGCSRFYHLALIHHRNPVAIFANHGQIVGDHQQGELALLAKSGQLGQDLGRDGDIQTSGRLIGHN